jgi:hypothetical protein
LINIWPPDVTNDQVILELQHVEPRKSNFAFIKFCIWQTDCCQKVNLSNSFSGYFFILANVLLFLTILYHAFHQVHFLKLQTYFWWCICNFGPKVSVKMFKYISFSSIKKLQKIDKVIVDRSKFAKFLTSDDRNLRL